MIKYPLGHNIPRGGVIIPQLYEHKKQGLSY